MWIFGYGSLIWKIDFPFEKKIIGYIKGYKRRFYQHSTDHRGTPEKPGRVVTLIAGTDEDEVWGIAYKIKDEDIENVINHLDYREKGGYTRKTVLFYAKDQTIPPFELDIYIATECNANFAGETHEDAIAEQIVDCIGPNTEYLLNLAKAMRTIAPNVNDEHLFNIEKKVLNLLKKK